MLFNLRLLLLFSLGPVAFAQEKEPLTPEEEKAAETEAIMAKLEEYKDFVPSEIVTRLDFSNIDTFLNENPKVFVEYYIPYQEHILLAPEFQRVAETLLERGSLVKIAMCNVSNSKNYWISRREKVHSFPTMSFYESGMLSEKYKGELTYDDILPWLLEREISSLFDLPFEEFAALTADGDLNGEGVIDAMAERFRTNDSTTLLAVALNLEGSKRSKKFRRYAIENKRPQMAFVNVVLTKAQSKTLKKREGIMSRKGIHIVRLQIKEERDGGPLVTFTGKLNAFNVSLNISALGMFADCDDATVFKKDLEGCVELREMAEAAHCDLLQLRMATLHSDEAAANRFKDSMLPFAAKLRNEGIDGKCVIIGITEGPPLEETEGMWLPTAELRTKEHFEDYEVFLSLEEENMQRIKVVKTVPHIHLSTEELTAESVTSFVEKVYAGIWGEYYTSRLNDPGFERMYRESGEYKAKQKALATGDFKDATSTLLEFFLEDTDTFVLNPDYDRIVLYKKEPCKVCTIAIEKLEEVQKHVNSEFVKQLRHQFLFGVWDVLEFTNEYTDREMPFLVLYPKGTKRLEDGIRLEFLEDVKSLLGVDDFTQFLDEYSGVINADSKKEL